jgi:arsenate reductase (thioredoxin)
VCNDAAEVCPLFPGPGVRMHWPFDDPARATGGAEAVRAVFARVRDEIAARIEQWLAELPSQEGAVAGGGSG